MSFAHNSRNPGKLSDAPRVALLTPLPPARTGTADYAAALLPELSKFLSVDVFQPPNRPNPSRYDLIVYQVANNPHHDHIYNQALEDPGVVVLHEVNLHHLIQGKTLNNGDAPGYLREVLYEIFGTDGDPRVSGEITHSAQPHEFTLARRLLQRSKACIVHSAYAESLVRSKGFRRPVARIHHGAAIRELNGSRYRHSLGLADDSPLLGLFGYQRPDKKAMDCLLLFRELLETVPTARLIVVGEPHPEVPVEESIQKLGLKDAVFVRGYQGIEDFDGYLAACDIVLNFRRCTFGETSGITMRALGLGKTVMLSESGASRELPDEICVKIPSDQHERQVVLESLKWLTGDISITREIGRRAQQWVARECEWTTTAAQYADFLCSLFQNGDSEAGRDAYQVPASDRETTMSYLAKWVDPEARGSEYFEQHRHRLARILERLPPGGPRCRILEMGCYLQLTPALRDLLGYGEVRGCYLGAAGGVDHRRIYARDGQFFECLIDLFDAEADPFPYRDESFDTVLCSEILEHLQQDPMQMMFEIHRVLKPGGNLLLTTPNAASARAVSAVLKGQHPGFYTLFSRPGPIGAADPPHKREYTAAEIFELLTAAGFAVQQIETLPYGECEAPDDAWVGSLLEGLKLPAQLRGDCIYALAKKADVPRKRFPSWLYEV